MDAQALYEIMCARRSCRAYRAEQVPADMLDMVLQAGRMAPSGRNVQLCHYLVLRRDEHLRQLQQLVTRLFAALPEGGDNSRFSQAIKAAQKGDYDFFYSAPTLIVVANRVDNHNNIADSAIALQNMMLMATALGLGNCWINQLRWLNEEPELLQFLRVLGLHEGESVYGALALGFAQQAAGAALPRSGNLVDVVE